MSFDEKMAEKYCNDEFPFITTESGEKLYTENDLKYAYLTALRAGSQLDMVWHDYDAGEDSYEDLHEGRWVKRDSDIEKNLIKAKDVIEKLLNASVSNDFFEEEELDAMAEAERFLKETK